MCNIYTLGTRYSPSNSTKKIIQILNQIYDILVELQNQDRETCIVPVQIEINKTDRAKHAIDM